MDMGLWIIYVILFAMFAHSLVHTKRMKEKISREAKKNMYRQLVHEIVEYNYTIIQALEEASTKRFGKVDYEIIWEFLKEPDVLDMIHVELRKSKTKQKERSTTDESPSVDKVTVALSFFGFTSMPDKNTLKTRYRQLAAKYHPDRNPGISDEVFKELGKHKAILDRCI